MRTALRAQLTHLLRPGAALEILRPVLPRDFAPADALCTVQSVKPDRFVVRAQVRSGSGKERSYALKVYSDDFVARVWAFGQVLAENLPSNQHGFCLPMTYLADERMLIFPWVEGKFLSEIVDERKPELLRLAANVAADLHRQPIVPEEATTAQMFVAQTHARCERLRNR